MPNILTREMQIKTAIDTKNHLSEVFYKDVEKRGQITLPVGMQNTKIPLESRS